ncbi:isochorismatase [Sulfodiicoccus acidiphilus]|uniref:Isochorismatase n=1 Tax=Sulfodiicoccus acidiphilus TaxID=1670455 RepID=A0A348B5G4_9CREN|nr:isochorismatase family cysteine hydrolase [Sulfodiicoccus acidiphilus]BBD73416.1 isochorismatase [Sulfodiicoccus acidiphilus]GGT98696.1 isochorismatase [Sulfodiicoccus acidiphilus]
MSSTTNFKSSEAVLLVWDVQRGLVKRVFNEEEFLKSLRSAITWARERKVPVIYTKITPFPKGFDPPHFTRRMQFSQEELELQVSPGEGDVVINKNTWSAFVGTNLELLLRNSGRRVILIAGISTEVGVETTARHAYALGFLPVVLEDAVSSFNRDAHDRSLANLKSLLPVIRTADLDSIS